MTAQPQLVQGCTICGVPSDPESEMRETAEGGRLGGGGLSFGDFSLATQRKVTRPGPKGGRNSVEGRALVFHGAKPHQGVPCRFGARTVAVERDLLRCNALRLLHPTVCHCVAKPRHHINSANVRIRDPIRTYGTHQIANLRGTLTPLALSRRERGQRDRTQKR